MSTELGVRSLKISFSELRTNHSELNGGETHEPKEKIFAEGLVSGR